jgi:hypothetical protein
VPIPWENLLGEKQPPLKWLEAAAVIDLPVKVSPIPALRLEGGASILTGKPLLGSEQLSALCGKTIRVFVWMRGEGVGEGDNLWSAAPSIQLLRYGMEGSVLDRYDFGARTRGTFPWHCYSLDLHVPELLERESVSAAETKKAEAVESAEAETEEGAAAEDKGEGGKKDGEEADEAEKDETKPAEEPTSEKQGPAAVAAVYRTTGLYVHLANPSSGTAWFSTISWCEVDEDGTYSLAERQDPVSGSLAPNPRFDELPLHFVFGKPLQPAAYRWNFLRGDKGGAAGVPDITSNDGFTNYYRTVACTDFGHMINAVSLLADWYSFGLTFKTLPPLEAGWIENVGQVVLEGQNEKNGFWGYSDVPASMALTAVFVERLFGAKGIPRSDRDAIDRPWLSFDGAPLPRAAAIIDTVLAMQRPLADDRREKGAWDRLAFDFKTSGEPDDGTTCSLPVTSNAVSLLRRALPYAPASYQTKVDRAVRSALRYVFDHNVESDGLWRQLDTDRRPSSSAYMFRLLEASPWLERRTAMSLLPPELVPPQAKGGVFAFSWQKPDSQSVSARVYAVPKGTGSDKVNESHLLAVLQKDGTGFHTMDPLLAMRLMRRAAESRWGETGGEGATPYIDWKLGLLPKTIAASTNGQPVTGEKKAEGEAQAEDKADDGADPW